jgi:hypothetical protein
MLDHHPQISFHFEFEYAVDRVGDDGTAPPVADYCNWLATDRVFGMTGLTADPTLGYRELVDSFLEQKRRADGKPIVGATVHRHFDRLVHLWPDARFIHLLRDGRDVARSCIQMGWAGNLWTACDTWIEARMTWQRLAAQLTPDRWIEVRSEDLVCDAEAQLQRVCRFLGVAYDAAMFDYADHSTYERPDPSLTYQWKRRLSDDEVRLAEARIGPMLKACGYELSGLPAMGVTDAMQRRLKRQDWRCRAAFRIQRYGLPLVALSFLARKLRLRGLERRVQRRIDAITNQHIR